MGIIHRSVLVGIEPATFQIPALSTDHNTKPHQTTNPGKHFRLIKTAPLNTKTADLSGAQSLIKQPGINPNSKLPKYSQINAV